jgi:hypothetical protein
MWAEQRKRDRFTALPAKAAEILEISRATADRYWSYARAWLFHEISRGGEKNSR